MSDKCTAEEFQKMYLELCKKTGWSHFMDIHKKPVKLDGGLVGFIDVPVLAVRPFTADSSLQPVESDHT